MWIYNFLKHQSHVYYMYLWEHMIIYKVAYPISLH